MPTSSLEMAFLAASLLESGKFVKVNVQQPANAQVEVRLFDRIKIDGSLRINEIDYPINDLSVGGVSIEGSVPGWEEGEVRGVQFTIRHGALEVSGKTSCELLDNGANGITRLRLVSLSEDLAEFFRAATLRSLTEAEYDASWLPQNSTMLEKTEAKPRRSAVSFFVSLPMLVFGVFLLLLGTFVVRQTDGVAFWVTETHAVVSPVTGVITSLGLGPFAVGDPISEIAVVTVSGEEMLFTINADVASVSADWRFSTGDRVSENDVLGHLKNVPTNQGRVHVMVSLKNPFFRFSPGESIVIETVSDQRIVGRLQRLLTEDEARDFISIDTRFSSNATYALLVINDGPADFSAQPSVRMFDTILENKFR